MNRSLRCAGLVLLLAVFAPSVGCGTRAPVVKTAREGAFLETAEKQLRTRLENDADEPTMREALEQFNSRVARKNVRPALEEPERQLLRERLHLGESDLAEVDRTDFSGLDGAYLNETMLLSIVVRGLDLDKRTPSDRARLIVEWVGRQVYTHSRNIPPGPVWYVLQSGQGSVGERASVMLALLRQAGFNVGLVGPASAIDVHSFRAPEKMDDLEAVANPFPFTAIGVLVEKEVLLFDPSTGRAVPSADGKSIATIASVRGGNADPVELFMAPPLAGLSTRMQYLEELLSRNNPLRLSVSLSASRSAFEAANLGGAKVLVWNPAGDFFTPTMNLSRYLPTEQGGLEPRRAAFITPGTDKKRYPLAVKGMEAGAGNVPMLELFLFASLPDVRGPVARFVGSDRSQAKLALFEAFVSRLNPLRVASGSTRDIWLHGNRNKAVQQWTAQREVLENDLARLRNESNLDENADTAFNRVVAAEADVIRARSANRPDLVATAEQNYQGAMTAMRKALAPVTIRDTADLLNADYTYSLALSVHEKAERDQSRASAGNEVAVREAWENASDWWQRYLSNFPALGDSMKDRNAHAQRLADRAKSFQKPSGSK